MDNISHWTGNKYAQTHGLSKTKLYRIWTGMRQRCNNPKSNRYPYYGGRGIQVDPAWDKFSEFHEWAIASGYEPGLEINRINNNQHYTSENCTWSTRKEQCRNKRNNHAITAFSETKLIIEWVEDRRCVVKRDMLYERIRHGWNPELAITTPSMGKGNGRNYRPQLA